MSTVRADNCQVVQVTPTIRCGIRNCNKRSVRTRALTRFYRPQGRVLFLHVSVILFTGRGLPTRGSAYFCLLRGPTYQGVCLIRGGSASWRPPGHCRGRYAFYWNALFLFLFVILSFFLVTANVTMKFLDLRVLIEVLRC